MYVCERGDGQGGYLVLCVEAAVTGGTLPPPGTHLRQAGIGLDLNPPPLHTPPTPSQLLQRPLDSDQYLSSFPPSPD